MKTNKDRIKEYLIGRGWVNKGEIVNELVSWGGGYADTIGRQLRLYSSSKNPDAFLKSRPNPNGKGTEYTLKTITLPSHKSQEDTKLFDILDPGKVPEKDYSFLTK